MQAVAIEKLTPERRRQQTRDALVDAAAQVFVRRGFSGASLDEIAEAAGFTRGAIYKHFEGKDDLFLAVFDRVNERTLATFGELLEHGAAVAFDAHRLAQLWAELVCDPELLTLQREFRSYEVRNPKIAARSAAQRRRSHETVTRFMSETAASLGVRLRLPAETMAGIMLATSDGFAQTSQVEPGQTELYEKFLELIIPVMFETSDPD
jgi:AcrR family transcriptional regulator